VVAIALIVGGLAIGGVFSSSDDAKKTAAAITTPAVTTPAVTTPAVTTPASSPPEMQGPAGTMGPPPRGQYDVRNRTVLKHIAVVLKVYLATKGIPGARVKCRALTSSRASCDVTNPANGKMVVAIVKVNQTTGKLTLI
jgi:hypothetical protein